MSLFVDVNLPVTAIPPGGVVTISTDVALELERVVPTESRTHYIWLVGENYQEFLDDLRAESAVESITILDEHENRVLVRLRLTTLETPFFDLLDESDVVLVEARGTADGWEVTLRFPDETALGRFYETSEQLGLGVKLRAINGTRLTEPEDSDALSPVQWKTLEAAFEAGYFDVPRSITIAELADQLGRSEQAVSEALRRALGNYLRTTIQQSQASENNEGDNETDRQSDIRDRDTGDDR